MKLKCLNCGASLVKVKNKYICNNYHRGLGKLRCPIRFTITQEEIEKIISYYNVNITDIAEFKVNYKYHYQIILYDGTIKGYDGSTFIL